KNGNLQIYLACTKTNETGKFLHTESLKVHLSNSRTPLYPYSWEIYLLTAFVIFSSRIQVLYIKAELADKWDVSQNQIRSANPSS
ncbi:hypothetical protein ABER60_04460, partial [Heyndrickxia coagulans]|uniref:hypothetical protein n=1 Tax=Heyndrickxia coagulans TaxID=1398 RepID=UPI003D1C4CF7